MCLKILLGATTIGGHKKNLEGTASECPPWLRAWRHVMSRRVCILAFLHLAHRLHFAIRDKAFSLSFFSIFTALREPNNSEYENYYGCQFEAECCCNLSVGVTLNVRFTTNGMCAKNNTHIYVARTSNNRVIMISTVACCHSVKLCALAARAFRSQQCQQHVFVFFQAFIQTRHQRGRIPP